jgi:hypothetical protein
MFTTQFNDSSILITIISWDYLNLSLANEYVGDVIIPTQVIKHNQNFSKRISQSDCNIHFKLNYFILQFIIYRLIHGHFHIGLVIIPRPPYWPETQSSANMGRGMIWSIWKCPCIKSFITCWNFAWNRVFSFSQLFWLFGIFFFFRNSRFPARSVFVINVSLLTSVVCYCQHGLRRKHGKCSLCNEWWHSFMNQRQRLNHLVLLRNCIKIMSLNTCNKNVDIIWHYCIISQIKPWFLKTISSHKY